MISFLAAEAPFDVNRYYCSGETEPDGECTHADMNWVFARKTFVGQSIYNYVCSACGYSVEWTERKTSMRK